MGSGFGSVVSIGVAVVSIGSVQCVVNRCCSVACVCNAAVNSHKKNQNSTELVNWFYKLSYSTLKTHSFFKLKKTIRSLLLWSSICFLLFILIVDSPTSYSAIGKFGYFFYII